MSLRTKLVWAFVGVALTALVLAAVGINLGLTSTMHQMHQTAGMGMMEHDAMMTSQVLGATLRWSLLSSVVAFLIAGGAGLLFAERITRSLRLLRDAAQRLDLRDLSRRVSVQGQDEIAELATSFNRMAERLDAADRSRRHLLADVAHELRHPLANMQGRMDLILDGKVELDVAELLPLQDEIGRLRRMVGDLRDLSLAEVGGLALQRGPVDLSELLRSLALHLEVVAEERGVEFAVVVPEQLPLVEGDPDRLKQVFINLLTNAMQYVGAGDRVALRAWVTPGEVHVAVSDTGPGIPPEHLPHLFDRFYRVDASRSRGSGGSGLGLAIVRSLVELHGGRVGVASQVGVGTTFTVTLLVVA